MFIGVDASRANKSQRSGVEWYAYHLLKHFYKLDHQNHYCLYTPSKLLDDLNSLPQNFHERVLKWPPKKLWTLVRLSWEMLNRRPDVFFVPSHTFPLLGGRKNVITWHDVGYLKYPETYTQWELASLKQGAKRAMRLADKIITISNFTKGEIIKFYNVEPDKIKVIHLGCDYELWRPIKAETVKSYLQSQGIIHPYFIYLGRLALRKNIVGLIRIYNRFREKYHLPYNLVLAGPSSAYQEDIDKEIGDSPFKDEIKKVGWLPLEKLPVLLSGAQALVFPSIYEGFGLPTIEAMACGCPVIASNAGSLPEVVGPAGVTLETHDINGFAQQMIKIVEDKKWRQDLINQGLLRAKEFSWLTTASQTLEVLYSV